MDLDGNRLTNEEDKNKRWKEHFQNVLNCPEPDVLDTWSDDEQDRTLAINTAKITAEEVKMAVSRLKNHRGPGDDLISWELLKSLGEAGLENLTCILNNLGKNETVTNGWRRGLSET